MEFFKSTLSRVYSSATFPYQLKENTAETISIWKHYQASKKEDNTPVSIFVFDSSKQKQFLPYAQNALKKFKTIRHPSVLKYIESIEIEPLLYIITEPCTPLSEIFQQAEAQSQDSLLWAFLNNAQMVHGNLRMSSIFISRSGEWKVAGLETVSPIQEASAILWNSGNQLPQFPAHLLPETSQWHLIKSLPVHSLDAGLFAILVYQIFNSGEMPSQQQLQQTQKIPAAIIPYYKKFLVEPSGRLSISEFLKIGQQSFFKNEFIEIANLLENISVADAQQKIHFFKNLPNVVQKFPPNFSKFKILPVLMQALEFGSAGPKILPMILKIGKDHLSKEEYTESIISLIVRLFQSPDRAIRVGLLENMNAFAEFMDAKLINEKIFPHLANGFSDALPLIREWTVKSVLLVAPYLNERNLNNDLVRHLAKCQGDEEPGIRVNATICIGKIAKHLLDSTRQKILLPAFGRALRDGFPPSRSSALLALIATSEYYSVTDLATKALPSLIPSLIDSEGTVRKAAIKAHDHFYKLILSHAEKMPETAVQPPTATQTAGTATDQSADGWGSMVGSLTKKIAGTVLTSAITSPSQQNLELPASSPPQPVVEQPVTTNLNGWGNDWDDLEVIQPKVMSLQPLNKQDQLLKEIEKQKEISTVTQPLVSNGWADAWDDLNIEPNQEPNKTTITTSPIKKETSETFIQSSASASQNPEIQRKREERRLKNEMLKQQKQRLQENNE